MPRKFTGMSKKSKQMPCIRHRPRASSTSFSGNCGAKFGRKLKNLSETTADDTDNNTIRHFSLIAAEVVLGRNVRIGHATIRVDDLEFIRASDNLV
jgi:hypothetical protein